MSGFRIPNTYGYVVLSSAAIAAQCLFVGFAIPMSSRKKYFNKEYLEKNFGDIHKTQIGHQLPELGYPDMGSGKYAQNLSYRDWFYLNNAMRCHQSLVEQVGAIIPLTLGAGIFYPELAAGLGALYFITKSLYIYGYMSDVGPNKRKIGAVFGPFIMLADIGLCVASGIKLLRYIPK